MYKSYEQRKKEFDDITMAYIGKRVFQDINQTKAFYNGVIDAYGNEVSKSNKWDYTNFDRFILAIKQRIGEDGLRELLSVYSGYQDVDDLMIINSFDKPITKKSVNGARKIISKLDSIEFWDKTRDETLAPEDDSRNMSWAFTIMTFLLFSLKFNRCITSIEFNANVIRSTEITFNVSAVKDFDLIKEFCINAKLIDDNVLTSKAIKLLVELAKICCEDGLLTKNNSIDDKSRDWEKLSERG